MKEINQALGTIEELKQSILDRKYFNGYSGEAKLLAGSIVLIGSIIMSLPFFPNNNTLIVYGWAVTMFTAFLCHVIALVVWLKNDPEAKKNPRGILTILDILPPVFSCLVFSFVLYFSGHWSFIYGTWLIMYGIVQSSYRRRFPLSIWLNGWFLILCGSFLLFFQKVLPFNFPLPIGLIIFATELFGAAVLLRLKKKSKRAKT